jgi:protein-tyrosine phosphatase
MPVRVCFVCMGNICRSPTAHGIFEHLAAARGLAGSVVVESAGTGAWHLGEAPDPRSAEAAARHGVMLRSRARQFCAADFARFDHVLAMDRVNRRALLAMAPDAAARGKVQLLRSFDPAAGRDAEVPDPYYGGAGGFDDVFAICEAACRGLLVQVEAELAGPARRP